MTSTPTRPVDNVVITTKGLQDRNIHILDGTTEENKGKLITVFVCLFVVYKGAFCYNPENAIYLLLNYFSLHV